MVLPISEQASRLINALKEFDLQEFEEWWYREKGIAGSTHVIEYLERKSRGKL